MYNRRETKTSLTVQKKKTNEEKEERQQETGRKRRIADANAEEQLTEGDRRRTGTSQGVQVK